VFYRADDYEALLDLMAESSVRIPMRILAYCLMPNHFHLTLWPREDAEVSRWMH
jgi:putative transposase